MDVVVSIIADGEFFRSQLVSPGIFQSRQSTVYDDQGRAVETVDSANVRTGTVYYPDGQVRMTGTLAIDAPAEWYRSTQPEAHFHLDVTSGRRLVTEYRYGQGTAISQYDEVIDALGQSTKTYTDLFGRVTKTVYADGSCEEAI